MDHQNPDLRQVLPRSRFYPESHRRLGEGESDPRQFGDQKTNFPVQTPPFREEPGLVGVCAAPSKPLVRGGAVQAELSITNARWPGHAGVRKPRQAYDQGTSWPARPIRSRRY